MADNEEIMFALGEIKADIANMGRRVDEYGSKLDRVDQNVGDMKLNAVQSGGVSGGITGAITGVATAFGVSLIAMNIKGG